MGSPDGAHPVAYPRGAVTDPAPDPFRRRFRLRRLAWIGLATVALGTGPLLLILLAARMGWSSDPNPNPVGPGMLAMCTFWPGAAMTVIGLALSVADFARDRPPGR